MKIHKPLTNATGDVREVTLQDLKQFKPAADVLAGLVGNDVANELLAKRKPGRPKAILPKVYTGMRLDADVLAYFKSEGQGWQTRINDALKALITNKRR